ncbi:MAG TPA: CBU_0585 family protein [Gammaproteobacteria bacterium]|nr:CBU_0585 family protein [Gammaproteobacteria bacterium]
MNQNKTIRNFVSEIDQFLAEFDRKHPAFTQSQQKEATKYQQIYYWRDIADRPDSPKKLWEKF